MITWKLNSIKHTCKSPLLAGECNNTQRKGCHLKDAILSKDCVCAWKREREREEGREGGIQKLFASSHVLLMPCFFILWQISQLNPLYFVLLFQPKPQGKWNNFLCLKLRNHTILSALKVTVPRMKRRNGDLLKNTSDYNSFPEITCPWLEKGNKIFA